MTQFPTGEYAKSDVSCFVFVTVMSWIYSFITFHLYQVLFSKNHCIYAPDVSQTTSWCTAHLIIKIIVHVVNQTLTLSSCMDLGDIISNHRLMPMASLKTSWLKWIFHLSCLLPPFGKDFYYIQIGKMHWKIFLTIFKPNKCLCLRIDKNWYNVFIGSCQTSGYTNWKGLSTKAQTTAQDFCNIIQWCKK